jgi:hypothetical protein
VITLLRFQRLERAVKAAGFDDDIAWAERLAPPRSADAFAREAVYVIVNSGMKNTVALRIFERCMERLEVGMPLRSAFKHPGKSRAIRTIWREREQLFDAYCAADDKLGFCAGLPWIGPVTSYHLAKDLGADLAKPDVHLARLARVDRTTVERLCRRLARQTGYRVATVDTILWRACEQGILNSRRYEAEGWRAAFRGAPRAQR